MRLMRIDTENGDVEYVNPNYVVSISDNLVVMACISSYKGFINPYVIETKSSAQELIDKWNKALDSSCSRYV